MKVLAKDFHRIFNERTKPVFLELGFKRSKANAQGWQRSHDDSQVLFWPQLDKWGWNEENGSRVAFNFSVSADATTAMIVVGQNASVQPRWCRLGNLLSFDELETVRRANNVVALRTWPPNKDGLHWRAFEASQPGLYAATYGPKDEPIKPGVDTWLRYLVVEDVEWIGSFIAQHLPSLIERMLANPKISAFGATYATEQKA
jgi:hypothetical protein